MQAKAKKRRRARSNALAAIAPLLRAWKEAKRNLALMGEINPDSRILYVGKRHRNGYPPSISESIAAWRSGDWRVEDAAYTIAFHNCTKERLVEIAITVLPKSVLRK